jgi:L-aspartate oxidase
LPKASGIQLIIVGAGAAGMYTAVCASREGAHVALVSSMPLAGASSFWAQGGLAAAVSEDDTPDAHIADTIAAGRGCVRESAARVLCAEAPAAVEDLLRLGVRFDADRHGHLALGLEGGHSARRVVHAGGAATGRRLIRQLSALVAEDPNIEVFEDRRVTAVLTDVDSGAAAGVRLLDSAVLRAPAVVMATGGAAALWARTTNPTGATGSGLLLAHLAGAKLADLELLQFHPTAVVAPGGEDGFLVTEAVRGEGALLLDWEGNRFVDELAPRDEVARAIQHQLTSTGVSSVALDMRRVDPALFPNVVSALRRGGIDPERELVPVAPAAHYMMGGIATGLDASSSLPGLYAVGECSCTGLHGANRLASNSLTECFVFGARAARAALHGERTAADGSAAGGEAPSPALGSASSTRPTRPPPLEQSSRDALWRYAGLERDADGLHKLLVDSHPLVRMIATCALTRTESRGAHVRVDLPATDPRFDHRHVTIGPTDEAEIEEWR